MKVTRTIKALNPDMVINAAAYTDVDLEYISRVCSEIGAILIRFSTDYVFGGTLNEYRESDTPNPINVYGRSKVLGETNIIQNMESCPY